MAFIITIFQVLARTQACFVIPREYPVSIAKALLARRNQSTQLGSALLLIDDTPWKAIKLLSTECVTNAICSVDLNVYCACLTAFKTVYSC